MDPYQIHLDWSDSDSSYSGKSELDEEYYKYKPPPIVIAPEDIIVIEAVKKSHENDTEFRKHFPKYAENVVLAKINNQKYQKKMEVAGRTSLNNGTNERPVQSDQFKKQMKNKKYALARIESHNQFDVLASSGDEDENEQIKDDVIESNHSGIAENYPNDLEEMLRNGIFDTESFVLQKKKHKRKKIKSEEKDSGDQKKINLHENITLHSNREESLTISTTKLMNQKEAKKQEPNQNDTHHQGKSSNISTIPSTKSTKDKKTKKQNQIENNTHHQGNNSTVTTIPPIKFTKQNKNKKQRPIESEGRNEDNTAWTTLLKEVYDITDSQYRNINSKFKIYEQGKNNDADTNKTIITSSEEHVTTYSLYKYSDSNFEIYDGPLIRDEQVPIFQDKEEFKCSLYPTKVPSTKEKISSYEIPQEKPDLNVHKDNINQTTIGRPIKKRKKQKLIFIPIIQYEKEDTLVPHDINPEISNKKVTKKHKTKNKQKKNTEYPISDTNKKPMTQWDQESMYNWPKVVSEGLQKDEQYNLQNQHVIHQSWTHSSTDYFPNFIRKSEAEVNQDELVCSRKNSNYTDQSQRTVPNERVIGPISNVYHPEIIQNYLFKHNLLDSTTESYKVVTETYSFNKSPLEKSADYSTITNNHTTLACSTKKRESICVDKFEDDAIRNKHEVQFRHHPIDFKNTSNEDISHHSTMDIGQKETSRVIKQEQASNSTYPKCGTIPKHKPLLATEAFSFNNSTRENIDDINCPTITINQTTMRKPKKKNKKQKSITQNQNVAVATPRDEMVITFDDWNEYMTKHYEDLDDINCSGTNQPTMKKRKKKNKKQKSINEDQNIAVDNMLSGLLDKNGPEVVQNKQQVNFRFHPTDLNYTSNEDLNYHCFEQEATIFNVPSNTGILSFYKLSREETDHFNVYDDDNDMIATNQTTIKRRREKMNETTQKLISEDEYMALVASRGEIIESPHINFHELNETTQKLISEDENLALVASRAEIIESPYRDLDEYFKRTTSSIKEYDEESTNSYCSENMTYCNDANHSIPKRPSILTRWLDSVSIIQIAAMGTYLIWLIHSLKKE